MTSPYRAPTDEAKLPPSRAPYRRLGLALIFAATLPLPWSRYTSCSGHGPIDETGIEMLGHGSDAWKGGAIALLLLLIPVVLGFLAARDTTVVLRLLYQTISTIAALLSTLLFFALAAVGIADTREPLWGGYIGIGALFGVFVDSAYLFGRQVKLTLAERRRGRGPPLGPPPPD